MRNTPERGRAIILDSRHFLGLGRTEDRSAHFGPFLHALTKQLAAVNPQAIFLAGMPPGVWWTWVMVFFLVLAIAGFMILVIRELVIEGEWLRLELPLSAIFVIALLATAASIGKVLAIGFPRRSYPPGSNGEAG
jgi:hypothetical protein